MKIEKLYRGLIVTLSALARFCGGLLRDFYRLYRLRRIFAETNRRAGTIYED